LDLAFQFGICGFVFLGEEGEASREERALALEKTPEKQVGGAEAAEAHLAAAGGLVWPPNPLRLSQLVAQGKLPPWPEFLDHKLAWDVSTKHTFFL